MKAILEDLNQRLGARGSLVVTRDGLPVCAVLGTATPHDRLDRLAAMGAAILSDVRRSLAAAGLDEFTQCEVAAEQGKVVLVGPRIEIGPGSVEIRSAARQIEKAAVLATA